MTDATVWPPRPFDIAFARFAELDAWYAGDTATLHAIYSGQYSGRSGITHTVQGRSYRGGVLGTLSKWWWGQPIAEGEGRMKMHLPLAADLCTLSADLLFGEAPQVMFVRPDDITPDGADTTVKWKHPAQDRLDELVASDESHAEWLLAGEYAAALGGAYVSVAWDKTISDRVFPKVFAADCAIPHFRHGRLASVRLWTEYAEGSEIYRLVEEHQPGTITFSLYRGTAKVLGAQVPLGTRLETTFYETMRSESDYEAVALGGDLSLSVAVGTGSDHLAVVYLKNAAPVRDWRKLGELANLGRSDLDGIQDILDKVDQTWSSLLRDVDNGQGRLIVSEDVLELTGTGQGAQFDTYRQVFTPVGSALGKTADGSGPIGIVQFDIRVQAHLDTIEGLKKELASALGYSESHLGIDNKAGSGDRTATAVTADLSDSERTRDKKALYAKAAMAQWSRVALEIDATVFSSGLVVDELPDVVFAPVSQADPEKNARTAQLLDAAHAASRKEIVRTIHPEWDEQQLDDEVDLIEQERNALPEPSFSPFDMKPPADPTKPSTVTPTKPDVPAKPVKK